MNLKKINEDLKEALIENGITEATELQLETFSPIKSGADLVIQGGKKTGKTTAMVVNVIHKLKEPFQESPRALILVNDKPMLLEVLELFELYNKKNKLRVFGTHDKTDLDEDKNLISLGIDVLVGTPNKLNQMFSSAGFNVNTLQVIHFDDIDVLLKNRHESVIMRLMESIQKGQRVFFCNKITERVEILADNIMKDPVFLEMDE
ncbi:MULTISPECIES: DEAD/DEAH box helicase [Flavobacterium]|uniref:DEAD/DEAH box helicase n=1 Tax=Flavobacterium jumunjinense TaxID=998845 RepID=A0ABV5GN90_9FLAO|nr:MULTISPECIES: DEAD/DEAH box helicase [Flavobacterium]